MKNKLYTLLLLLTPLAVLAQVPANDECATAINLGIAPSCDTNIVYSNENATQSVIGDENNPTCFEGGIPNRDVWFSFICPDTLFDFRITLTGTGSNSIVNPQFAVYRGDCTFNDLFELLCAKAELNETGLFLDLQGLTPGITYYIRVSDYSTTATPNSGDFTMCVGPIPPIVTIDEGGSNLCAGTISDSGGPDGDYSSDEDFTYVICPNQPTQCITFTLQYYNMENGSFGTGDELEFFDGPDINSPSLGSVSSGTFGDNEVNGGVCFMVQASSGCLTLHFTSDSDVEFEGFLGSWQCSNTACPTPEVLAVDTSTTNQDIVNAVQTAATTVTVTDIRCPQGGYGTFSYPTANNDLQMGKGIVLSSGSVLDIPQPGTSFASTIYAEPGDDDLDALSALQGGEESNDACVLEMDVFVATNQLAFEYVFGSEEYPEFVFSPGGFNDIFAFLVSGPGIVGSPVIGGQENIALIPGVNVPVEINSVNNQVNWEFYRNNENGPSLVYDGLTSDFLGVKKSLTAKINTIPCNTYRLKLAIADRGDASYDSGVFISEIKGGTPDLAVNFASGIDYFIEDCSGSDDELIISIDEPQETDLTFNTSIGGTATLGVDYTLSLPGTITIPAGQTQVTFPIAPIDDNLNEGTEVITISLSNNFGCGTVVYKTISIELKDNVEVDVNAGQDTLLVCAGTSFQLQAAGAVSYFWQPAGAVSNPIIANPIITPTQDIWLQVTGTIESCVDVDSVYIKIVDPAIELTAGTNTNICVGQSVPLLATNNVNNQGLVWSPTTGISDVNSNQPLAAPTTTTLYEVSVTVSGCTVSDTITIAVDTLFFPTFVIEDTTVCQNYPVLLAEPVNESTTYTWSPLNGLNNGGISGALATPDQNTTYTLVATSANGFCSQTATAVVNVIAADVDIEGPTFREICLGTTVNLQAVATPASTTPVTWSPTFSVTNPTGLTTSSTPDESVTIIATYNVNGCTVRDSVRLRVDSLPDLKLRLMPVKDIYCQGDTVKLISKTYEPANFPDIRNTWLPDGVGQITPDSLWNMVIRAQQTDTFTRITINRACRDTSSIVVPVDSIPEIMITASKNPLCPGELITLNVTVDPPTTVIEWEASNLSCMSCLNPTANPLATDIYRLTTPQANCPGGAAITIEVLPVPIFELAAPTTFCAGEVTTIQLNTLPAEPGVTYTWTSDPVGFVSSDAQPVVQPNQTTTYNLVASNGCAREDSVTLTVASANVDAGPDQSVCAGRPVALNADTDGLPGFFFWSPANKTGAQITETPLTTTTYTVEFTFANGQCEVSDEVTVNVVPAPVATLAASDSSLCEGVPYNLVGTVNFGTPPYTYAWTQNGAPITGNTPGLALSAEPGTYTYVLVATDATGCTGQSGPLGIEVRNCLRIPNAFTPGQGDSNGTFRPIFDASSGLSVARLTIYNRWGQKVFTSTAADAAWDGTVDGSAAPVDVYIYQVVMRRADNTEESTSGEVHLLR
jgi:gliding motility-associated-like protein